MFDAEAFCRDNRIDTARTGHKHKRRGWVNVVCPFCTGNPGWHGGFNVDNAFYNCHRCGKSWLPKVISVLCRVNIPEAKAIAKRYTTGEQAAQFEPREYADRLEPPPDLGPLINDHARYLEWRGFDSDELIQLWDVQSIGRFGESYRNRIYIPITFNGRVISYTSRDVTGQRQDKYRACPEKDEVFHHKFTLYGIDNATEDTAAVVEGVFDVWRWGPGAVATMGTKFTAPQVALLAKRFKRVFIFFDPDDAGLIAAEDLYQQLDIRNVDCEILVNDSGLDPGDTPPEDIAAIKKELGW